MRLDDQTETLVIEKHRSTICKRFRFIPMDRKSRKTVLSKWRSGDANEQIDCSEHTTAPSEEHR